MKTLFALLLLLSICSCGGDDKWKDFCECDCTETYACLEETGETPETGVDSCIDNCEDVMSNADDKENMQDVVDQAIVDYEECLGKKSCEYVCCMSPETCNPEQEE